MPNPFFSYEIVFLYNLWWSILSPKEKEILSNYTKEILYNNYQRLVRNPSAN